MLPIAVGGFHHQPVGGTVRPRRREGGIVGTAQVAGERQRGAVRAQPDGSRAGDPLKSFTVNLNERAQKGEIDPTFVITHRMGLDQAAEGYRMFNEKKDNCEKIVLKA